MRIGTKNRWNGVSGPLMLALCCGLSGGLMVGCQNLGPARPGEVAGRYILTIGDADMAGSALSTKELGERDSTARDTMTVVTLPLQEPTTPHAQIEVSNSALCPPTCLSVSRDGNWAFVVEYRGPAGAEARMVSDLPVGNKLTAVDLRDPLRPVISATVEVSKEPIAVAVHPDGDLVAVVAQQARQQIVITPFKDGQFSGEPAAWPLIGLDADDARPSSIAWHPDGKALGVTLQDRGEVMFYRFKRGDGGELALAPWGDPVKVGKSPMAGAFSADGRHFIVNNLQWGDDVDGYNVGAPAGQLVSIRLGDMPGGLESAEGGAAKHEIVSTATVGVSPIGMAINREGTLIVTANLQRSHLPDNDARVDPNARGGSISAVALSRDGTLTSVGEYTINAMPAGISFDASDRFVCVTQFRSFDPSAVDGELGFWQVGKAPRWELKSADFYVGVGKGPHGVLIVR